jgi:hypothetical protein
MGKISVVQFFTPDMWSRFLGPQALSGPSTTSGKAAYSASHAAHKRCARLRGLEGLPLMRQSRCELDERTRKHNAIGGGEGTHAVTHMHVCAGAVTRPLLPRVILRSSKMLASRFTQNGWKCVSPAASAAACLQMDSSCRAIVPARPLSKMRCCDANASPAAHRDRAAARENPMQRIMPGASHTFVRGSGGGSLARR